VHVRREDVARLRGASPEERCAILEAGSGPDLPLALAAAEVVDVPEARAWVRGEHEGLARCGAIALAERADPVAVRVARDPRSRVREGVVIGLQRLGERDPMGFSEVLDAWRGELDPLVQAVRVAAVRDPVLLTDLTLALLAVEVCAEATAVLRALPDRGTAGAEALRDALGTAWGVAVAAAPAHGLPAFRALEHDEDPDVARIVRANRADPRLARLL
jgi:hypothetical protein